ncbi:hypothetical protein H6F75_20940 [Nodosilinea sp. FACHB-131]|uniref:hypothetical protein n=1 Tax=Cyanophyceae TaxID=3028117 RepID=UPI001684FBDC|nr:hypothetical protein [Nodosilinea sp. FACHB-131]MBD1875952.1 hypothetical protein [Nodosilinea sp. FACHB-131]
MTVAIELANAEDLRTALGRWLEDYGHSVYRQVPCPEEGVVDLLTPAYAIYCPPTLTPADLWATVDKIQLHQPHFPDQRSVIAGLTPEEDWESAQAIAEQIQPKGIEIWFLDQMPQFVDYYRQLNAEPLPQPSGRLTRRNPLAGCLISLGMAVILSASFWLAYRILDRYQLRTATSSRENRLWEQLHSSVEVWDMDTTLIHLERLQASRSPCASQFAERFEASLRQQGAEGFRDINPIKRALNLQNDCRLEIREYDFSK